MIAITMGKVLKTYLDNFLFDIFAQKRHKINEYKLNVYAVKGYLLESMVP